MGLWKWLTGEPSVQPTVSPRANTQGFTLSNGQRLRLGIDGWDQKM